MCCNKWLRFNSANAVGQGEFYTSGSYGIDLADKFNYDDEFLAAKKPSNANVFGLAVGYGITDNIRAELAYNSFYGMKYKYDFTANFGSGESAKYSLNQKVAVDALFISTYYGINKFDNIKPYVGVDVGMANVKAGDINMVTRQEGAEDITDQYRAGANQKQLTWQVGQE